jgi:trehalose 6-phosphate phosphatase
MEPENPATLKLDGIGLLLDVDGTLLDFAPEPDAVEIPAALPEVLRSVERRLNGAIALVSGRPIAELDRLFTPLRLRASGIHGAEIRFSPGGPCSPCLRHKLPDAAWRELVGLLSAFPGTFAENKGVSFTVHYRECGTGPARLVEALGHFIDTFAALELELLAGHLVFEVKLSGFDKGTAIERFMAQPPFMGRRPVFVADDELDRAGFNTVLAMGGLAFSVGGKLPGLSGWFTGPEAVRTWLRTLGQ